MKMEQIDISTQDYDLAKFLKAIGNPVRLAIIERLIEKSLCPHGGHPCSCGEKCEGENCKCGCRCGELVDLFPMSQSTVSQHIKELKKAGLIDIKGRKGDYMLNHEVLKEGISSLLDFAGYEVNLSPKSRQHDCCDCGHQN